MKSIKGKKSNSQHDKLFDHAISATIFNNHQCIYSKTCAVQGVDKLKMVAAFRCRFVFNNMQNIYILRQSHLSYSTYYGIRSKILVKQLDSSKRFSGL